MKLNSLERFFVGCLCLLIVGYVIQIVSPLRLTGDVHSLLSMAISAHQGKGYLVDGHIDPHPIGYPFLVKTLLQFGIANSMTLILLNLVFLFVGLLVCWFCFKDDDEYVLSAKPIVIVLSSWVMIKHTTLPLTELLYFAVSSLSLFFIVLFQKETTTKKWVWLVVALALAFTALQCRSIGIVIFPVLLVVSLSRLAIVPVWVRYFLKQKKFSLVLGAAVVCFFVSSVIGNLEKLLNLSKKNYLYFLLKSYQEHGGYKHIFRVLLYRIIEFGEIFANVPSLRAPQLRLVFIFAGFLAWGLVLFGAYQMFHKKSLLPLYLYFVFYVGVMILWPYYDARFWLPLLPVLVFLFHLGAKNLATRWPFFDRAFLAYQIVFLLIGFAVLLNSTRTSVAGKEFSEFYGRGDENKMTYRYVFDNGKPVDMNKVNFGMVKVLRVFEPLAATTQKEETKSPDDFVR